jgi:predicted Fe-Mo cluster-binding NifX family protein
MKVAIPHWQGRVSPVFDVAGNVLIVELNGGTELGRRNVTFDAETMHDRAARLAETGADVLICGAISRPLEMAISAAGTDVIPQTCGDVDQVLAAFAGDQLDKGAFLMPGCCGLRRRFRGRRRHGWPG